MNPESSFKMAANQKKDNDVTICRHDIIAKFFWHRRVCLLNFSYWFKFHVNNMIGSGVMTIFVYKGLTKNLETGTR